MSAVTSQASASIPLASGTASVVRASSAPSHFSNPTPCDIYWSSGKSLYGGGDLAGGIIGGVALGALLATMFMFLFMLRQRGRQGAWLIKWLQLEPTSSVPPAYSEALPYGTEKSQKLEVEKSVVVTLSAV